MARDSLGGYHFTECARLETKPLALAKSHGMQVVVQTSSATYLQGDGG